MDGDLSKVITRLKKFRDDRNWSQFHTPKNLAESLVLESSEVMEYFQWKNDVESEKNIILKKKEFSYELADVFTYLLLLSDKVGIDLIEATNEKIDISEKKYPVEKAKDNAKKYNEFNK